MEHEKNGGPAFPFNPDSTLCMGMTVRDCFALGAIQGLLSCENSIYLSKDEAVLGKTYQDKVAEEGYLIADAMLKARQA